MKKLSLILALLMLLSLIMSCGCSDSSQPAENATDDKAVAEDTQAAGDDTDAASDDAGDGEITEEMLENSKPNEYVREKLDAGMDVLIGCSMIADVPVLMEVFAGDIESVIEPYGFQWQITHAGGDPGTMISQIENYALMGAACVVCVPPDAGTVKDAVLNAMDMGTDVVLYGVTDVDFCYSARPDVTLLGQATTEMALMWIEQRYPDAAQPIKLAAMHNSNVVDAVVQGESMIEVAEASDLVEVVYVDPGSEGSVDYGFEFAQAALTYDNGIRVIVSTQGTDALGASNYIISQPRLDYSEYGVFGGGCDTAGLDAIENMAKNDEAVLRGSMEYSVTAGQSIGMTAVVALFDEQPCPYEYIMEGYAFVQPGFECDIVIK